MRQQVEVKQITKDGYAQVAAYRESACSGDCHHCSGCGAVKQTVLVEARNPIGAKPGDLVVVQTDNKTVFLAIAVVYCLPLVLLLAGYFMGAGLNWLPGLCAFLGFALGVAGILAYNKHVTKQRRLQFTITAFASR